MVVVVEMPTRDRVQTKGSAWHCCELEVVDESPRTIEVGWLFNAGYAGRDSDRR